MTLFQRASRSAVLLAGALILSACGNGAKDLPSVMFGKIIADKAGALTAAESPVVPAEEVATRVLAATDQPVVLVQFDDDPSARALVPIQSDGAYILWGAPDRRTLTTYNGVLVESRGLVQDMMSSDVTALSAALARGTSGTVPHVQRYLTPEYVTETVSATCALAMGAPVAADGKTLRRVTETCRDGAQSYENTYVVDASGQVISAHQWVSPMVGHVRVTRLR